MTRSRVTFVGALAAAACGNHPGAEADSVMASASDATSAASPGDVAADVPALLDVRDPGGGVADVSDWPLADVTGAVDVVQPDWPPDVSATFDALPYSLDVSGTFAVPGYYGGTAYCDECEGIRAFAEFGWSGVPDSCISEQVCFESYEGVDGMAEWVIAHIDELMGVLAPDAATFDPETEVLEYFRSDYGCVELVGPQRVFWRANCREMVTTGPLTRIESYWMDRSTYCCGAFNTSSYSTGQTQLYRAPKACAGQAKHVSTRANTTFVKHDGVDMGVRHWCEFTSTEFVTEPY